MNVKDLRHLLTWVLFGYRIKRKGCICVISDRFCAGFYSGSWLPREASLRAMKNAICYFPEWVRNEEKGVTGWVRDVDAEVKNK